MLAVNICSMYKWIQSQGLPHTHCSSLGALMETVDFLLSLHLPRKPHATKAFALTWALLLIHDRTCRTLAGSLMWGRCLHRRHGAYLWADPVFIPKQCRAFLFPQHIAPGYHYSYTATFAKARSLLQCIFGSPGGNSSVHKAG